MIADLSSSGMLVKSEITSKLATVYFVKSFILFTFSKKLKESLIVYSMMVNGSRICTKNLADLLLKVLTADRMGRRAVLLKLETW